MFRFSDHPFSQALKLLGNVAQRVPAYRVGPRQHYVQGCDGVNMSPVG
jgi:hypothetical protein